MFACLWPSGEDIELLTYVYDLHVLEPQREAWPVPGGGSVMSARERLVWSLGGRDWSVMSARERLVWSLGGRDWSVMSARERLVRSLGGQRLGRNECQREACSVPGGTETGA